MKKYEDLDLMMKDLGGITYQDAIDLKLADNLDSLKGIERSKNDIYEWEDFGDWAAIFCCSKTDPMVLEIAKKHNLQIVTYTLCEVPSFSTGMHFVDREKYMFCRSFDEAWCDED